MIREKRAYHPGEREEEMERKRKVILDRAEEAFIARGLAGASMTDIAGDAGVSRRTLYRYYPTLEELAFAVEFRIFSDFNDYLEEVMTGLKGKGFDKIRQVFRYLASYIIENQDRVRFTGEFDHYFSGEYPSEMLEKEFIRVLGQRKDPLEGLLEEGKRDGSVKAGVDAKLMSRTIGNSLLSLSQRIAIRGSHLAREQGIDPSRMLDQLFSIFLDAVKK